MPSCRVICVRPPVSETLPKPPQWIGHKVDVLIRTESRLCNCRERHLWLCSLRNASTSRRTRPHPGIIAQTCTSLDQNQSIVASSFVAMNTSSFRCLSCSQQSLAKRRGNPVVNAHENENKALPSPWIICAQKNCGSRQHILCAFKFYDALKKSSQVTKTMLANDLWCQFIAGLIRNNNYSDDIYIFYCMKCEFSRGMDGTLKSSIMKPQWKRPSGDAICIPIDDHDIQEKRCNDVSKMNVGMTSRRQSIKIAKSSWMVGNRPMEDSAQFLRNYFNPVDGKFQHTTKMNLKAVKREIESKTGQVLGYGSKYDLGAMYFPTYDLLVESRACNNAIYVDIVGLGKSVKDGTMAVPHGVLGLEDAGYLDDCKDDLPAMPCGWKLYFTIDNVSSPEDLNLTRSWRVEFITVPQKYSSKLQSEDKGKQLFNRTKDAGQVC
jgi:hypothetical protein